MTSPAQPSDRVAQIRERLEQALAPALLEIEDDSASHAGHVGARDGGGHFNVTIACAQFADKTPLQRHRLVYEALGEMMNRDIHALSIRASLP